MSHTEEEAKKKWCPMYRPSALSCESNRDMAGPCIASACMAWRWAIGGRQGFCGAFGEPHQ